MRFLRTMLVTGALAALPLAAHAQKAPAAPQKAPAQKAPGAHAPAQGKPGQPSAAEAQMRVMKAQQQALEKPAVKKELEALEGLMQKKMVEADPESKPKIARLEVLKEKLDGLSKEPQADPAKAQPLVQEAQQLASQLGPVQQKVMQQADVKKKMDAFDKNLLDEMKKIDPEVPSLMAMLQAGQGAHGAPGGGH